MGTFGGLLMGWDDAKAKSLFPVTEGHVRFAKGNKASAIIWLSPTDFLTLTVPLGWVKEGSPTCLWVLMEEAKPFDPARAAEETQLPFLTVELETKRVSGHEGRHRAAGLIKSGYTGLMPVAIMLRENTNTQRKALKDIPALLKPQNFGPDFINRNDFIFIEGRNTADALDLG